MGSDTNLRNILTTLEKERPKLAIIDSIQTIWSNKVESAPGTVSSTSSRTRAYNFCKRRNKYSFSGHVTKEGQIAGPRVVEHMVDKFCILKAKEESIPYLTISKNRFGAADEIGVFEMTG